MCAGRDRDHRLQPRHLYARGRRDAIRSNRYVDRFVVRGDKIVQWTVERQRGSGADPQRDRGLGSIAKRIAPSWRITASPNPPYANRRSPRRPGQKSCSTGGALGESQPAASSGCRSVLGAVGIGGRAVAAVPAEAAGTEARSSRRVNTDSRSPSRDCPRIVRRTATRLLLGACCDRRHHLDRSRDRMRVSQCWPLLSIMRLKARMSSTVELPAAGGFETPAGLANSLRALIESEAFAVLKSVQ